MNRKLKLFFIIIVALYIIIFFVIYIFQEKMIFMGDELPSDFKYEFSIPFEEIDLSEKDGAKLNALHFKVANPKGLVLYFHGNAGDLSRWGQVTQKFTTYGYDVLVMDYRTYGKSTGTLNEASLYGDAQLFYNYSLSQYPEDKIIVYGRSLGTTFATYVAAENKPKLLILEAPFYSLTNVAKNRFPIYPVAWFLRYSFPTYTFISKVKCPTIIFHGKEDSTVPFENSEALQKLLPKKQLQFVKFEKGNHHNLVEFEQYSTTLEKVLK